MSQLYKKTEYVLAMPAHRQNHPSDDADAPMASEYAIQPCDASGKPLSTHLSFLSDETFAREYTPVRRRPKPQAKKAPVRIRDRSNNKTKIEKPKDDLNQIEMELK